MEGIRRGLQRLRAPAFTGETRRRDHSAAQPGARERGTAARKKLSYKETRELESLPAEIESLEAEQKALLARMHEPQYYRQPPQALRTDQARAAEIERLLEEKLERWTELELRAGT